jgi:hypothetical protein
MVVVHLFANDLVTAPPVLGTPTLWSGNGSLSVDAFVVHPVSLPDLRWLRLLVWIRNRCDAAGTFLVDLASVLLDRIANWIMTQSLGEILRIIRQFLDHLGGSLRR